MCAFPLQSHRRRTKSRTRPGEPSPERRRTEPRRLNCRRVGPIDLSGLFLQSLVRHHKQDEADQTGSVNHKTTNATHSAHDPRADTAGEKSVYLQNAAVSILSNYWFNMFCVLCPPSRCRPFWSPDREKKSFVSSQRNTGGRKTNVAV